MSKHKHTKAIETPAPQPSEPSAQIAPGRFMRVKKGFSLYWPNTFPQLDQFRGAAGYVVDTEDVMEQGYDVPVLTEEGFQKLTEDGRKPVVRHVVGWSEGQAFKLEPAVGARAATPITHPTAIRLRANRERELGELHRRQTRMRETGKAPPERPGVHPGTYSKLRTNATNFQEIEG